MVVHGVMLATRSCRVQSDRHIFPRDQLCLKFIAPQALVRANNSRESSSSDEYGSWRVGHRDGRGCSNAWILHLERRAEESRKCFLGKDVFVWQVAILRATAAYFRQTERGGGKEVDCDDSLCSSS